MKNRKFTVVFTNSKGNKAFVVQAPSIEKAIAKAIRQKLCMDFFCVYAELIPEPARKPIIHDLEKAFI